MGEKVIKMTMIKGNGIGKENSDRYDTHGRIIKMSDGSEDYIITEWDSKRNSGKETRITSSGRMIYETKIGRETYNWAIATDNRGIQLK